MSSPAGTCYELAYLSVHKAMPTFVVGTLGSEPQCMYLVGDLWGLQPLLEQSILGCVSIQLSVLLFL